MIAWIRSELGRLARETESGQAMVEFVLVFPVQLFLTLAIIQYAFICHAQIVVGQAAFMGARAAAVSDGMSAAGGPASPQEAARRSAARILGVLTSASKGPTGGSVPSNGKLQWTAERGKRGYSAIREQQVYTLLRSVDIHPTDPARAGKGYVSCDITYDYLLQIPVASHFFAKLGPGGSSKRWTTYRIRRVGFVATPWWGGSP